ncbi:unnamed protein product [Soboliphyme baturini]|uniref:Tropomyosin n=1 Tax=Soboliphyme baturini TaxID=241478 RepID=A0A183IMD3_9BILA|nr:unnamed protein product [Soboliphyme baturini]
MDAIKKKMQAMKIEKDNAVDRADAAEEKSRQMQERIEKLEEELRDTQKKMMQVENELDKAQEELTAANIQLEEKDKKVQEVCAVSLYSGYGDTAIVVIFVLLLPFASVVPYLPPSVASQRFDQT